MSELKGSTFMTPKHTLAAIVLLAGSLLPCLAQIPMATEPLSRVGKAEFYGIGQYLHSEDINFNGPFGDVKVRMDDTGLGGFGFAFHFNDFFSVRTDFMFGGATFNAEVPLRTGGTAPIRQDALLQTGRLNLDYNIINRRLTPFITAGLGYQYTETELENAPPVNTCWWDPWYGWICYSGHAHAWQTDFTWNAAAGVRWNVTDNFFVKAMGGATWLEYSGTKGVTTQIEGIFCIGWTF
jgi:opacity protein-like surface antigen